MRAGPEPRDRRPLKAEVRARWGTVPLIDIVLRTGYLVAGTPASGRDDLAPEVLAERLLLAIYANGAKTGIRDPSPTASGTAMARTTSGKCIAGT